MVEQRLGLSENQIENMRSNVCRALGDKDHFPLPIAGGIRSEFARFFETAPKGLFDTLVMDQFVTCLTMGPWLTDKQFNTLAREVGIGSILHRNENQEPGLVIQNRDTTGAYPGKVVFDLRLDTEHTELVDIAAANAQVINYLQTPLHKDIEESDTSALRSTLDMYDLGADHTNAVSVLRAMNYMILDHETFYEHMPAGPYFRERDGDSFWVEELPMSNTVVYTGKSERLLKDPLLLWSNMTHEIGSHILMGEYLQPKVQFPSGDNEYLHPKLLFPVWFWEGAANVIALRYFHHRDERSEGVAEETDFNDLFLDNWNGTIPSSKEILKADENLSYFFHTVFCSFFLQSLGRCIDPRKSTPEDWTSVPSTRHTTLGLQLSLQAINHLILKLPRMEDSQDYDIGHKYMELLHGKLADFIKMKYGQNVPPFKKLCEQFDVSRDSYVTNWIKQHFAQDQQQKAFRIMTMTR